MKNVAGASESKRNIERQQKMQIEQLKHSNWASKPLRYDRRKKNKKRHGVVGHPLSIFSRSFSHCVHLGIITRFLPGKYKTINVCGFRDKSHNI